MSLVEQADANIIELVLPDGSVDQWSFSCSGESPGFGNIVLDITCEPFKIHQSPSQDPFHSVDDDGDPHQVEVAIVKTAAQEHQHQLRHYREARHIEDRKQLNEGRWQQDLRRLIADRLARSLRNQLKCALCFAMARLSTLQFSVALKLLMCLIRKR